MMIIIDASAERYGHKADIVIDLRHCDTMQKAIDAMSVLRGARYDFDVSHLALDGLVELFEDWMSDNFGKKIYVRVNGFRDLVQRKYDVAAAIITSLHDAELGALEEDLRKDVGGLGIAGLRELYILLA